MTFANILDSLILGPLTILFECIFQLSNTFIHNPGLSIVSLSLIMNILVLPLYKRADDMQEEARCTEEKLRDGVALIKKAFTGDERMMILQTYYRQNNYKPTHALKGSVSLLLQIPFFMAAYNFLSTLAVLQGASLGPIRDLGVPDGLLSIGGWSINVLPVLMTLVNVISSAIYLKGFPLKTKIQIYGMAMFFLVFLYNSPAGLVFYWTLNNVFSLGKTIYYKLNIPGKAIKIAASLAGLGLVGLGIVADLTFRRRLLIIGFGLLLQVVWLRALLPRLTKRTAPLKVAEPNQKLFIAGSLFLTVLVGAWISSTYIAASPQEFVDTTYFYHPLWYVLNTLCLAAGTFMIWMRVFYWLAKPKAKVVFEYGVWVAAGIMMINYLFFGLKLGNILPTLQYEFGMRFAVKEQYGNLIVLLAAVVVLYLLVRKWGKQITNVLVIATVVLGVLSLKNTMDISKSIRNVSADTTVPEFRLDTEGQNVVVIMLDRAMGEAVPYIFNEIPELKEQFDGFTYYDNTISFGAHTNFCVPALMGGYEYTPVELNADALRPLVEKHNESLKVMPVLFSQNGYDVSVGDPTYANYQWIPDLSIYDEYPQIKAFNTAGKFTPEEQKQYNIEANLRNFYCFSLMKCMPVTIQKILYEQGNYLAAARANRPNFGNQILSGLSISRGYSSSFMQAYNTLTNLSEITNVTSTGKNNFMLFSNEITHCAQLLQTPDYTPAESVDNTAYDVEHSDRFVLEDGSVLNVDSAERMKEYHANVAALIGIGEWLEYLKTSGVYDNTRIILVSDHGNKAFRSEDMTLEGLGFDEATANAYFPLLMVKDFNSEGFTVSHEFMTNADVPTLAVEGLIDNPTNPFTGNPINSDEKSAHDQYIITSGKWDLIDNGGNVYLASSWLSVSENLRNAENWEFYDEEVVLKEHVFPE